MDFWPCWTMVATLATTLRFLRARLARKLRTLSQKAGISCALCYPLAEKRQSLPLKLTPPLTNKKPNPNLRKIVPKMTPTTSTTYIYKIKKLKNNFWTPMPIYINEIAQRTIIKILIILFKTNGEFLPKQTRIVFVNK